MKTPTKLESTFTPGRKKQRLGGAIRKSLRTPSPSASIVRRFWEKFKKEITQPYTLEDIVVRLAVIVIVALADLAQRHYGK
jgi:hypothetical protein